MLTARKQEGETKQRDDIGVRYVAEEPSHHLRMVVIPLYYRVHPTL